MSTYPAGAYRVRNLRLVAEMLCEGPCLPLDEPQNIVEYMAGAWGGFPEQEQCWLVLLDARNKPIGRQLITVGTMRQTLVSPREVFRAALVGGAAAVVLLHNHPSGDPAPSAADLRVTQRIREAAKVVEVHFHDHIIVGSAHCDPIGLGYYSFRAAGHL